MDELNQRVHEEFLAAIGGESQSTIDYSLEELKKIANQWEKEGALEKTVREARAAAAKAPPVFLTF